jgi:hypothetical protein
MDVVEALPAVATAHRPSEMHLRSQLPLIIPATGTVTFGEPTVTAGTERETETLEKGGHLHPDDRQ